MCRVLPQMQVRLLVERSTKIHFCHQGVAVSDSVTAAGAEAPRNAVFAAGHLGELTWQVPFRAGRRGVGRHEDPQRRLRDLPSRVGVYFVLALCLFPGLGYRKVWAKLTATTRSRKPPSDKALRDLRRRLGAAPLKALFEVLAGPVAAPRTAGVRFGRYRTVAFDGCVSFKVADTDRNRSWLGKLKASLGVTGYPVVRLMTVVETGTRALLGAVFGPPSTGEIDYARALLPLPGTNMLVLADRGFDAEAFLADLAGTGARFLVRLRNNRRLPVLARLDDGSHLSCIGALPVRVLTAELAVAGCWGNPDIPRRDGRGFWQLDRRIRVGAPRWRGVVSAVHCRPSTPTRWPASRPPARRRVPRRGRPGPIRAGMSSISTGSSSRPIPTSNTRRRPTSTGSGSIRCWPSWTPPGRRWPGCCAPVMRARVRPPST